MAEAADGWATRRTLRHLAGRFGGEARRSLAMVDNEPELGRAAGSRAALSAGRGGLRRPLRDGAARSTTCSAGGPGPASWPATPRPEPPPTWPSSSDPELGWDEAERARQVDDYRAVGRPRRARSGSA